MTLERNGLDLNEVRSMKERRFSHIPALAAGTPNGYLNEVRSMKERR